jgi:hypothetical protein
MTNSRLLFRLPAPRLQLGIHASNTVQQREAKYNRENVVELCLFQKSLSF